MARLIASWCVLEPRVVGSGPIAAVGVDAHVVVGLRSRLLYLGDLDAPSVSRFVGRTREMAVLADCWQRARGGQGQVVSIIGEPGIGKSRLVAEFVRICQGHGACLLETRTAAYTQSAPYYPIIALLRGYFGIEDRDDASMVWEKVTQRLTREEITPAYVLPSLLTLLDVPMDDPTWQASDPTLRRQHIQEAIRYVLVRESQAQPLVVVCEDLHWIDEETQAVLDRLVDSLDGATVLLVVTYCAEYQHPWSGKSCYTQLRLNPLPPTHTGELLDDWLGADLELQPLKHRLIDRAQGNPFFLEESVQSLVESQALLGKRGAYRLTHDLPLVHVPETVQTILAARIDRLDGPAKVLLHTLAVLGQESSFHLLMEVVAQSGEELQRALIRLQRAEFVYERLGPFGSVYAFKHALTQEVTYESLPAERRRVLHEGIAEAVERLFAPHVEDHYQTLAYHYVRSGNRLKALQYLQLAGHQSAQRSAFAAAITSLTAALAVLHTMPETSERARRELALQVALGPAYVATRGFAAPETEQACLRAQELSEQVGDTSELFPVSWLLWFIYQGRGDLARAHVLAERLLILAQSTQDQALLLRAHTAMGMTLFFQAELETAQAHLVHAAGLSTDERYRPETVLLQVDPGMACRAWGAMALWCLGYAEQAQRWSDEALQRAHGLQDPFTLVSALLFAAVLHQLCGEEDTTLQHTETLAALARQHGFALRLTQGAMLQGWVQVIRGDTKAGLMQMQQALSAWQAAGARLGYSYFLLLLIEAFGRAGEVEAGLQAVNEALEVIITTGERMFEAELHRFHGELWLRQPMPNGQQAERCFAQALATARRQQAKTLELRAAMSLSRLLRGQGRDREGHQLLSEVYGWFTEGFATANLQEAGKLLAELANAQPTSE